MQKPLEVLTQLQAAELMATVKGLKADDARQIATQTNAERARRGIIKDSLVSQLFGALPSADGVAAAKAKAGK